MHLLRLLLLGSLAATPLAAQHAEHQPQQPARPKVERPPNWKVRFDSPAADSLLSFEAMAPGWHITTGPRTILWDPANTAKGNYRVQATIHLFPGTRREAFGVFIGGKDLETDAQAYTYFIIRGDGQFMIRTRKGAELTNVQPWIPHPAILEHKQGPDEVVKNTLAVEVGGAAIRFLVNDQEVATVPRSAIDADGVVGLRVNHNLNLHVSELTVTPKGM